MEPISIDRIYWDAIQIPTAAARAAYLDEACQGDARLRQQIEKLLRVRSGADDLLEPPSALPGVTLDQPEAELPGTLIGPYKLLEQIGEGGFGVVFMAEQQEPIRRKVALKVLKPGIDSKQVIARFEAERQALALMDHPNIARVLDAGTTGVGVPALAGPAPDDAQDALKPGRQPAGRPYFVMELVKGIPITDYCDQNRLAPRERLELFVHVCQAVQHAHQKGIIHRDIKPSNVLVTLQDGTPLVKVIDFGIAKALGQQLTDKTLFTGFAQLIGTPLYMSPEQAALSNVDVDTRSDIYSLGVLLYELLTGTTPFDKERLKEVGFDELRRIIREEEPAKPSTRISTLGQGASTVSANRQSDPKRLCKLFRRELDWIVMKALEKDRNRRYETASAFAADVERYLKDEPVQACPPSAWYRLRKLARRNKVALAMATVVGAGLMTTALVLAISNMRIRAEQQETELAKQTADREKSRAGKNLAWALQALDQLYADLAERGLADVPHLEPLRQTYLERALNFYRTFATENSDDPALRLETAKVHGRLGNILRLLGQRQEAQTSFEQAVALFDELDPGPDPEIQRAFAGCLSNFGILLRDTRRLQKADQVHARAAQLQADLATRFPADAGYRWELARSHLNRAAVRDDMQMLPEAEQAARQAVELLRDLVKSFPKDNNLRWDLSAALGNLGNILGHRQQLKQAEDALSEADKIQAMVLAASPAVVQFRWHRSLTQRFLAVLLASAGRPQEAEPYLRQALALQRRLAADFPATAAYRQELAQTGGVLSRVLQETGRAREGLDLIEQLVKDFPGAPECQQVLAACLSDAGLRLLSAGSTQDAEDSFARALRLQESLVKHRPKEPAYRRGWAATLGNYGTLLATTGRAAEAEKRLRQALDLCKELWAEFPTEPRNDVAAPEPALPTPPGVTALELRRTPNYREELAQAYANLAGFLQSNGRFQEATQIFRQGLAAAPDSGRLHNGLAWLLATCPDSKWRDPVSAVRHGEKAVASAPNDGDFWNTLGVAHYRAGAWDKAVAALENSMKHRKGGDAADWFFLAMSHWQLGHKEEALQWHDRAVAWMKQQPPNEELGRFRVEAEKVLGIKNN
jgi:serine/threonine protein kinase/Flp pilus assembly protein TadD